MGFDLALMGLLMLAAGLVAFANRAAFVRGVLGATSALFPGSGPPVGAVSLLVSLVLCGIIGASLLILAGGILFETIWKDS